MSTTSHYGGDEKGVVERMSERRTRMEQSNGDRTLFVDAKFNRLIVELNLCRTEEQNNRPRLREWSYTSGFNSRVECTAISRKKD